MATASERMSIDCAQGDHAECCSTRARCDCLCHTLRESREAEAASGREVARLRDRVATMERQLAEGAAGADRAYDAAAVSGALWREER